MCLSLIPSVALATTAEGETGSAKIVEVSTKDELTAAVANGGYVKLTDNISANPQIPQNVTATIDLNGKTLTGCIMNSGDLTIEDTSSEKTGKITGSSFKIGSFGYTGCIVATVSGAKLTLNGGTLSAGWAISTTVQDKTASFTVTVNEGAVIDGNVGPTALGAYAPAIILTVNGGKFTSKCYQINADNKSSVEINNGTFNKGKLNLDTGSTLIINGGTFESGWTLSGGSAINYGEYTDKNTKVTINGGNFNGAHINVYSDDELFITNGEFDADSVICLAALSDSYEVTSVGNATISGGTFAGVIKATKGAQLTISGGDFSKATITAGGANKGATVTGKLDISGGTFDASKITIDTSTGATASISGGTFSNIDTADTKIGDYVSEGFKLDSDGTVKSETVAVAEVNGTKYETLKEAFDAVTDDTATTIKLLANCSGDGIQVKGGKNITVDFDGYTYTVDGETVGSAGTKTNGFQLLATSNITFKNGSIVSSKARILIQSYSNLTIENMTLDLSEQPLYGYTLSNNNGETVINNSTIKAPLAEGSMAFDACGFANYGDTTVTLKGNSVIEGDVVFSNESAVNSNVTLNLEGGTIKGELSPGTGAEKVTVKKSEAVSVPAPSGYEWTTVDGVQKLVKLSYVAEVNGVKYETLQAAIDAAGSGKTVKLIADTRENVSITKKLTLDLNGYTLNGGTEKGKAALYVTSSVTVKDTSKAQTGTIMREDTNGASGYYVIDIQGKNGFLRFEGGNVENDSGIVGVRGASLVRLGDDNVRTANPTLTITGGKFTQNNFVVIKVDYGTLHLNGGEVNSANSYAIENWRTANIKGGIVNGTVSSWAYSTGVAFSALTISGGKINGNVASVNYDDAADKQARIFITGGEITGTLGIYTYNNGLNPITDNTKATIEVTGGTFDIDPKTYVVEDSSITKENGKYSVAKAYLAEVDGTQYYTMDEAFKAQTASGKDIVLLRDYETDKIFNSGSINRTVDLNGHTWTYTRSDADCAAFEINYPDVMLTVKNGKVISNTLVGLIPTASSMSGAIKYDNSSLIFEGVEMTANGHSGIETNGGNTNNTVTLKNSILNVPNGYGIYFPSSGTLNIENSKINAKTMGVQVCAGSLNISDDSVINVTGDPVAKTENDGAIEDGAAISIVNRTGYNSLVKVAITGGTFKSAKGKALKAYKWENKEESDFDLSVIAVSGGTFSSKVEKAYCVDKYDSVKNEDDMYEVIELNVIKQLIATNGLEMTYTVTVGEGYEISYATFSMFNAIINGYSDPLKVCGDNGVFSFTGINPQRMLDTIKAVIYLKKGDKVYEYVVDDYSIKDYCLDVLKKYPGQFDELVYNLIAYGAEAQKYMNYRANDLITDYFENYSPVSHIDKINSVEKLNETTVINDKVKITAKQVILENSVVVRIYFDIADGVDVNDVNFNAAIINNGTEIRSENFTSAEFKKDTEYGLGYYFDYSGVMASELDNEIKFTATVGGDESTLLSFNVNWFLDYMIKNIPYAASLAEALFNYGYTCNNA